MQSLPAFKRVVTGHDAQGQAVVASCGPTQNNFPLKAVPGIRSCSIMVTTRRRSRCN